MDTDRLKTLTARFEVLKRKRHRWEGVWADIERYVCPTNPAKSTKQVFDSTPVWCREQLASGLQMLLVNPSYPWFSIKTLPQTDFSASYPYAVPDPAATLWEGTVEDELYRVFANPFNGFYNQTHLFFMNLVAYGTAVFYVEEAPELPDGVFFRCLDLKECFVEENPLGQVDSICRFFTMPARNASRQWPKDPVFQKMVLERKEDELVEILHVVRQQEGTKSHGKNSRGFAFGSTYIDFGNSRVIEEGGYGYFPFLVARWTVEDGDGYGSSPGGHVMADIKLLNILRHSHVKIMNKALDPPLLVPENGYHLPLSITPGSINFYRNGIVDPVRPVSPMENVQVSFEEMAQCREAIKQAFYIDLFRMGKESKEMTAAEVQARSEEQMRLMGAIVGRIETEFLNPLILSVYHILDKHGQFAKLKRPSGTADIGIEYISPLSRAQKSAAYNSTEAVLGFLQRSGIPAIYPEIYDNINWDRVLQSFVDLKGVPGKVMNTEEEKAYAQRRREMLSQIQQA